MSDQIWLVILVTIGNIPISFISPSHSSSVPILPSYSTSVHERDSVYVFNETIKNLASKDLPFVSIVGIKSPNIYSMAKKASIKAHAKFLSSYHHITHNASLQIEQPTAKPFSTNFNNRRRPHKASRTTTRSSRRRKMKKMMSLPPKIRFLPWTMLIVIILTNAGCHHNVNGDDTAQTTYGLGDHKISADGKVELAKEYREAEDTELQDYTLNTKGCRVGKQDNFYIVYYDENAAKDGCAVDFITSKDMETQIQFKASVDTSCLVECDADHNEKKATNENMIPFVFSQNSDKVAKLTDGPIYMDDKEKSSCLDECKKASAKGCIDFTALEIRWNKCFGKPRGYLHQVGEPTMEVEGIAEITTTPDGKMATMEINGNAAEGDTASFTYGKQPLAKPICIPGGKGVPIPTAWEVVNQESELKDLYLFVFNLLPQKSTREYIDADAEGISKVSESPPAATKMPTCKGEMLSFHFPSDMYSVLTNKARPVDVDPSTTPSPPTPTPMTETDPSSSTPMTETNPPPSPPMTGSTMKGSTTKGTKASTITRPNPIKTNTDNSSTIESSTEEEKGSESAPTPPFWTLPFIIVSSALAISLLIIIILIIMLCIQCRKNNDDYEEEEDAAMEEGLQKDEKAMGPENDAAAANAVGPQYNAASAMGAEEDVASAVGQPGYDLISVMPTVPE